MQRVRDDRKAYPAVRRPGRPLDGCRCGHRCLAELWGIDRADPALDDIARGIGADVPFFLHTSPALYVGGGDVLATEYPVLPATPVVLVKPHETSVSTVEAYRRFDESPVPAEKPDAIASVLRAGDAEAAYALVHNNLGVISAQMEPRIQAVLDWLRAQEGTVAVDVCGSGACSFAICDTVAAAAHLAGAAQQNAGGPARLSLFPTRFKSTHQRNKNFSSTRRKSLLL